LNTVQNCSHSLSDITLIQYGSRDTAGLDGLRQPESHLLGFPPGIGSCSCRTSVISEAVVSVDGGRLLRQEPGVNLLKMEDRRRPYEEEAFIGDSVV
jgi:hypothetical protein